MRYGCAVKRYGACHVQESAAGRHTSVTPSCPQLSLQVSSSLGREEPGVAATGEARCSDGASDEGPNHILLHGWGTEVECDANQRGGHETRVGRDEREGNNETAGGRGKKGEHLAQRKMSLEHAGVRPILRPHSEAGLASVVFSKIPRAGGRRRALRLPVRANLRGQLVCGCYSTD